MTPQHRLGEHGWLDAYAAPTVTPGGGSASAVAGALGCALVAMSARIGARKADSEVAGRLERLADEADRLRAVLAERHGARVEASEIVGLAPAGSLGVDDPAELRLRGALDDLLLESRLLQALTTKERR